MFKTKPLVICAVILITIFGAKNSTGSPYENLNTVTVTPTTAGVDHSYNAKPGGGYTHEFKLYNIDCIAKCSFRYYMTSGAGTALNSCSPITKGIKICPTGP